MLDLAVLGLLNEQPRHGYELRRQLADLGFWSVSFGSLYPALRRLEKQGLIEVKSQTGRRKSYQVTTMGEDRFREILTEGDLSDDERSFSLRLAFFRYLDADSRIGVLEKRRDQLANRLAETKKRLSQAAARTKEKMDRYTVALMEHGVASAEADIAWIDELIEAERHGATEASPRSQPNLGDGLVTE